MWRSRLLATLFALVSICPELCNATQNMYCGKEDCYAVLGVTSEATSSEIRRAFYELSLKYHPDKNPNNKVEPEQQFIAISTAYEGLKLEESRKEYDHAINHPEDFYANQYRYYKWRYAQKTNPYYVLFGLFLFVSVCHYLYWKHRYNYVRRQLLEHPQVKKRLQELAIAKAAQEKEKLENAEAEKAGLTRKKGKKGRESVPMAEINEEEELAKIVSVSGWQGRPPTWRDLLIFLIPKLVWGLLYNIYWFMRWKIKFDILGHPYGPEESSYVTAELLKVPWKKWLDVPQETRDELVARQLWIKENWKEYVREQINANRRTWR